MKNFRALTALTLCVLLFFAAACSDKAETAQTTVLNDEPDIKETTAESTGVSDSLPPDLDFGGETVTFYYREEVSDEFYAKTENGDIVNDALYKSMLNVEERLNVNIDVVLRKGHYIESRQEYMDNITKSVVAGEDLYDFVDLMIGNATLMMQNGIFGNLLNNKYIDLSKPWYIPDMENTVGLDNRLYFISGDASLGYLKCAFCCYYNKQMADNYGIEGLEKTVEDGKWTLDKLMELSQTVSEDLNSDGKYNLDDRLGFVIHDSNHPKAFIASCGINLYEKEDGEWKVDFLNERSAAVVDKIYQLKKETDGVFFLKSTNALSDHAEYDSFTSKFIGGEILVMSAELDDSVSQLRDMDDPFGILPFPKYNEEQPSYHTSSRNTQNSFSMPITCSDPDMAGAVMEALSCDKYNRVLPEYFEIALKTKYIRDSESAKMYDLIRSTMVLDFGYTYANAIGSPDWLVLSCFDKQGQFASSAEKNQKKLDQLLEKYITSIKESCPE